MDAVVLGLFLLGLATISLIFYVRQHHAHKVGTNSVSAGEPSSSTPKPRGFSFHVPHLGTPQSNGQPQTNARTGPNVRTTSSRAGPTSGSSARRSSSHPKGKAVPNYGRVPQGPRYTITKSGCWGGMVTATRPDTESCWASSRIEWNTRRAQEGPSSPGLFCSTKLRQPTVREPKALAAGNPSREHRGHV